MMAGRIERGWERHVEVLAVFTNPLEDRRHHPSSNMQTRQTRARHCFSSLTLRPSCFVRLAFLVNHQPPILMGTTRIHPVQNHGVLCPSKIVIETFESR